MTCRGSRFADGAQRNPDGEVFMKNRETDEWLAQNLRATRNFIRKWGHFVKHDEYMKPIIPPKYDIGFIVKNCSDELLRSLEPWCSVIYSDADIKKYIKLVQTDTKFDLKKRCHTLLEHDKYDYNDVIVEIDGNTVTQQENIYLTQLSEILENEEDMYGIGTEPAKFELGNLKITINNLATMEKDLIICKK
tara:strand:- start:231 stop:803 length:573 start_codon:yes stop_codon:yes gene_type:complete